MIRITHDLLIVFIVDIVSSICFSMYAATLHSTIDSQFDPARIGGFAVIRLLLYFVIAFFLSDYNFIFHFLAFLAVTVIFDFLSLLFTITSTTRVITVLILGMFILIDLMYVWAVQKMLSRSSTDDRVDNNRQYIMENMKNVSIFNFILPVEGTFIVFYVLFLLSFPITSFTCWIFLLHGALFVVVYESTTTETSAETMAARRVVLGIALVILFLDSTVVYQLNQWDNSEKIVDFVRYAFIIIDVIYVIASAYMLQNITSQDRSLLLFYVNNRVITSLLFVEAFSIMGYIVYEYNVPNISVKWGIFLHFLDILAGMIATTSRGPDVLMKWGYFVVSAFAVLSYEAIQLVRVTEHDKLQTTIAFESLMLAIPAVYIVCYVVCILTVRNDDEKFVSNYAKIYQIADYEKQMTKTLPSFAKLGAKNIPPTGMNKIQQQAMGLSWFIEEYITLVFYLQASLLFSYILSISATNEMGIPINSGVYVNTTQLLTFLSCIYVLYYREEIGLYIDVLFGFAIALMVTDVIFIIDLFTIQLLGGHYRDGFVVLRVTFLIIDIMYIVATIVCRVDLGDVVYLEYSKIKNKEEYYPNLLESEKTKV